MAHIVKRGDKDNQEKEPGYPIYFTCPKCGCEFRESSRDVTWVDDRSTNIAKTRCPQCGKKVKKEV